MAESVKTIAGVRLGQPPGKCLLCHTVDSTITQEGLNAGDYWLCKRCGQTWDAARLSAAMAYSMSVAVH